MKQIVMTQDTNCLICSAAMVVDDYPENIQLHSGTSGNEIVFRGPGERRRGHHIQEINDYLMDIHGKALTPIEGNPMLGPENGDASQAIEVFENKERRFKNLIKGKRAILIIADRNAMHAVAWDGFGIFDPKGFSRSLDSCIVREAWLLTKLI